MTYSEAKQYLRKASERGSVLGLERVTEVLMLMGEPQNKVPVIHISGTNGKGSFGAMLTSVLRCSGYKVGGFSSPFITDVTDSFRINGTEISKEKFGEIIGYAAEKSETMENKPTEFEVQTAAAFELFAKEKCDIALVECGMGGDLDSTNVVSSPVLSVITNVQLDHCGWLGNTVGEIAEHKSGIIKKNCPVFFGGNNAEALEIIRRKADEMSAELYLADSSEIHSAEYSLSGMDFEYRDMKLHIPLAGTYQLDNTVNVLSCIDILRKKGFAIPDGAVKKGLAETKWHGRFEILSEKPLVIYDGSHNPDGIQCAADSINRYFGDGKIALLIGVMADKEYSLYADMLGRYIDRAFTVKPDNPRSLDAEKLAETFSAKGISAESFGILADGVKSAYAYAESRNIPLIALGSLYMYREFREVFDEINE